MSVNKVILIGNVGKDPQVRYIADQRMYENKQANHARQDGAEGI